MTAYYNIHGKPVNVSAKDAVLQYELEAYAIDKPVKRDGQPESFWLIRKPGDVIGAPEWDATIGSGATEESAWRDAWSRMLADDIAKGDGK